MALDPQQLKSVQEAAKKAADGDAQAIAFFESFEGPNTPHARMFLDVRDELRQDKGQLLPLDMQYIGSLGLLAQQIKDGIKTAKDFAKGDGMAVAFYNGCETGKRAGVPASAAMLMLRDHVLAVIEQVAAAAPAHATATPALQQRAAVVQPPQHTSTAPTPAAAARVVVAPGGPAAPVIPVRTSSGTVVSLPPLNDQGLAVIDQAVSEGKLFNAASVSVLVNRIRELQVEVAAAVIATAISAVALPTAQPSEPTAGADVDLSVLPVVEPSTANLNGTVTQ